MIYIQVRLVNSVEGHLKAPFSIASTLKCRERHYSFPGLLHFTFDIYLIMLSAKQGGIKYNFLSLLYDSTIGKHSGAECSSMVWETRVQYHVESYQRLQKWYLMPPCSTLSIIRHGSRVKWSNQGNGVAPSLTHQCSSYWKGSLQVTLD